MRFLVVFIAIIALLASALPVLAQNEVYLYRGTTLSQSGITAGSWGSGKALESKEKALTGPESIKIITQSCYAGGRIDFAQPIPLFTAGPDPKQYIVFVFFFNDIQNINLGEWYDIDPYDIPRATKMRFVFESDAGQSISVEEPLGIIDPDDNWLRVPVSMAKFKLPDDQQEFKLKRLMIGSDGPGTAMSPATMYLGEAKIVSDEQPIKVSSLGSQTIALGDEIVLLAEARAGVSTLKYSWDWDARNGIQDETSGKIGRCTYTRGGDYTITLTVSDVDGLKTPVTATSKISVTD